MKRERKSVRIWCTGAIVIVAAMAAMPSFSQSTWQISIARNDHVAYELACHENGVCIATVAEGIFITSYIMRSTDHGHSWTRVHEDVSGERGRFPLRYGKVLFMSPTDVLITADSGCLLHSTDAGLTWTESFVAGEAVSGGAGDISIGPDGSGILSVKRQLFQTEPFPERVFVTRDSGQTWREVRGNLRESKYTAISPVSFVRTLSPGEFVVGFTGTIYFDPPGSDTVTDDSTLVFARSDGDVDAWTFSVVKHDSIASLRVPSMSFFDNRRGVLTGLRRGGLARGAILRTEDAGRSWEVFDVGVGRESEYTGVLHSQFFSFDKGFGNIFGKPVRTSDGGRTWTYDSIEVDPDIGYNPILRTYMFNDSVGAALTESGGFYFLDPEVSSVEIHPLPETFESVVWDQSRGPLTLELDSRILGDVDVVWFDVTGRDVDSGQALRGTTPNSVRIDPTKLSSGIYHVQITSGTTVHWVRVMVQ